MIFYYNTNGELYQLIIGKSTDFGVNNNYCKLLVNVNKDNMILLEFFSS